MAQWIGPYRILALLGRGGIAEVWLATDPRGRELALKRLHRATPRCVARLRHEGYWLSEIEHPNVVRALGSGTHEGLPFLLLEWAAGGSLESRPLPVPTPTLARWAVDVLAGLGALHAHGVVHRDVKPANLLLGSDGAMRVADLGVAWGPGAVRSRAGATLGSPAYMAPEQRDHPDHVGPAADVYALGRTLASCTVDPAWDRVISGATATAPARRFPSAVAMAAAIVEDIGVARTEPDERSFRAEAA